MSDVLLALELLVEATQVNRLQIRRHRVRQPSREADPAQRGIHHLLQLELVGLLMSSEGEGFNSKAR